MLPLPPRQKCMGARAENRPRCRLPQTGVRGIATRPSVGEIASDVLAPEVKSQRRRQTLLEMTSARSGLEIEFKLDGQSAIFAWTKRTSSVKWAVSALPSGAHPANLGRKLILKVSLILAIALLFAGSAALTADAQTSRGANNIAGAAQNFTPIEPEACRGWGPYCRPGFVRVCGRFRCWCRPCW